MSSNGEPSGMEVHHSRAEIGFAKRTLPRHGTMSPRATRVSVGHTNGKKSGLADFGWGQIKRQLPPLPRLTARAFVQIRSQTLLLALRKPAPQPTEDSVVPHY